MLIESSRRKFITGLVSFMATPAIVKASSLMPVKMMTSQEIFLSQIIKAGSGYVKWMALDLVNVQPTGALNGYEELKRISHHS